MAPVGMDHAESGRILRAASKTQLGRIEGHETLGETNGLPFGICLIEPWTGLYFLFGSMSIEQP